MLMRPPPLQEDNDNLSNLHSDRQSSKSRNKPTKKETSLSFKNARANPTYQNQQKQRDDDRGSVHSYASKGSKKSKKKQSSIGVAKPKSRIASSPMKYEQDEIEVIRYDQSPQNSYNYHQAVEYSEVKHDYVPETKTFQNKSPNMYQKPSFKNVFKSQQPSSFVLPSQGSYDEDIPVVRLTERKQVDQAPKQNLNYVASPKIAERAETKKLTHLFEENRRTQQNDSSLGISSFPSEIGNSSMAGESRRSRSKLGQLFKQKSKEKEMNNSSNYQKSVQQMANKSRQKQQINKNSIPQKNLDESIHRFETGEEFNRSDLNLSQSRNSPFVSKVNNPTSLLTNNRDSLCFNIEPEHEKKRKGLGVASKNMQGDISGFKKPEQFNQRPVFQDSTSNDGLIKISGNLVSKQIDNHERVKQNLKQNKIFLMESGALGQSLSKEDVQMSQKKQELQKNEQALRQKELKLEKQRRMISQQNEEYKQKMEHQREMQKKKQRELEIKQNSLREQEETRRRERLELEEQKKKQQIKFKQYQAKMNEQRLIQEQEKKKLYERNMQLQQQREQQIQREKQREREEKRVKEEELMKKKQQREQAEAKKQKQRMKQAYEKERKSYEQKQVSRSLIDHLNEDNTNRSNEQNSKNFEIDKHPSTYSREHSSRDSERSQQSKKSRKKKESTIPVKAKNKNFGNMSPRAEASFYEERLNENNQPKDASKVQNQQQGPRNLISFDEDEQSEDVRKECKTDSYFYDKSIRAPSSKPPLSRKSSSKSKTKQGQIMVKKSKQSQIKIRSGETGNGQKKLSLVELAMRKNYEGSGSEYQSQDSFRSGDNSVDSYQSKNSRGNSVKSKGSKKQSVIQRQSSINISNRPPSYRKSSPENNDSYMNRTSQERGSFYQQIGENFQSKRKQDKPLVIKGCSFIDERGRLVEKGNMIIKGNRVSGTAGNESTVGFNQRHMMERLMKSRQKRRSTSRERSLNRSRASSRSIERDCSRYQNTNSRQFIESEAYSETEGVRYQSSTSFYSREGPQYKTANNSSQYREAYINYNYGNYEQSQNYFRGTQGSRGTTNNLKQFMRPIEEAGINKARKETQNFQKRDQRQTSQKKRSVQRTEKGPRRY